MKLFHRNKGGRLGESKRIPEGTFRCDVCTFVQPSAYLCGTVIDAADSPSKTYTMCGACALWLGMGTTRFQQNLIFNFSERQFEKIKALQKELITYCGMGGVRKNITALANESAEIIRGSENPDEIIGNIRNFLDKTPNLRGLIKMRYSHIPITQIELADRLTRGEFVNPREIKKANRRSS